jgi:hypothetical protein
MEGFRIWAGDYRRFRPKIVQIGSAETELQFTKSRNWQAFTGFIGRHSSVEGLPWLGREDSNLRMGESKSPALPLGDAPKLSGKRRDGPCRAFLLATPVYRGT